jgi:hypothetical protein
VAIHYSLDQGDEAAYSARMAQTSMPGNSHHRGAAFIVPSATSGTNTHSVETTIPTSAQLPSATVKRNQRELCRQAKKASTPRRRRLRLVFCFVSLTVKPVGEPDAGNPRVRFDERGWETERCRMAQATAPILDSADSDVPKCPRNVRHRGHIGREILTPSISHVDTQRSLFGFHPSL